MESFIAAILSSKRVVLSVLILLVIAGFFAYRAMPKESDPDVPIPIVYVVTGLEGIAPTDAERLLARPLEQRMQSIEGLKELRAMAYLGGTSVIAEFQAGYDINQAILDVREQVDLAKPDLPEDADEPTVHEVNISQFPVLVVSLSGHVPERTLMRLAKHLQDKIEAISTVLEAKLTGDREELVELVIDPLRMESYGLVVDDLSSIVGRSNRLVAAGTLDTGQGRFSIKVPGLFETAEDILNMPVKVNGDAVVKVSDVAELRQTFKDPASIARMNGQPAVGIEVSKRTGTNLIETIEEVRKVVEAERQTWPGGVEVVYSQDKSGDIRTLLHDLENSLLITVVLVMIVIVFSLGVRGGLIVGTAVPGSFLIGILALSAFGITINIVVLFSLILATGMLVDGAIILVEYADRRMLDGMTAQEAYADATIKMAWPIFSSIATIIAAFLPMAFWPGVVGDFMKYLPITLTATLAASLAMAMIFVPVIGALIGKPNGDAHAHGAGLTPEQRLARARGFDRFYQNVLRGALAHPGITVLVGIGILVGTIGLYVWKSTGVEFFPNIEPNAAIAQVHARGNMSVEERDALIHEVEKIALDMQAERHEFKSIYSVAFSDVGQGAGEGVAADVVGQVTLEFADWQLRRKADDILAELLKRAAPLPGISVETVKAEGGPAAGKPIELEIASRDTALLEPAAKAIRAKLESMQGLTAIDDSLPIPGIDWRIDVDRAQAAKFGLDVTSVGSAIQLITQGLKFGDFRPDWSDDEIDIVARYPNATRNITEIDQLRVPTRLGVVPISNFVTRTAAPKVGVLNRVDGQRVLTVRADVLPDVLPDDKIKELREWLPKAGLNPEVTVTFRGDDEEQQAAMAFLGTAFMVTLFVIAIILLLQFNSFFAMFLVLSSVIMSTIGVMAGLLIMGQPFGIVMTGIGIIALAGIIVNNNIVLIDTYYRHLAEGMDQKMALLVTGTERLRPVILTKLTAILGLLPLVFKVNIDLYTRVVTFDAPATQWWTQLASAIVFGVLFASPLTLVFTPSALLLQARIMGYFGRGRPPFRRKRAPISVPPSVTQPNPAE